MKKLFLLLFLFSVSLHATDTTKQTRSVPVIIKVLKYLNLDQTQKKRLGRLSVNIATNFLKTMF